MSAMNTALQVFGGGEDEGEGNSEIATLDDIESFANFARGID